MQQFLRVRCFFFFSSRRRHTRSYGDWSSDVCSSDLPILILPYMPTIGPDGNLYVTAGAICPADGSFQGGGPFNPCLAGGKPGGKVVKKIGRASCRERG